MKNILLIVDPQNDFITGSLAVNGAEDKMLALSQYLKNTNGMYDYICITMDSHPKDHCSFKANGGIWPEHCVCFTQGWDFPEYLNSLFNGDIKTKVAVYHKGTESNKEEYSIFTNEEDGLTFERQIKELFKEGEVYIDVCGIAGDYCVLETLRGLRRFIGSDYISILGEFTASIDGGSKLGEFSDLMGFNYITDSSNHLTEYKSSI